jgi:hypothetical protein
MNVSPKDFLKSRRPSKFSDSTKKENISISRPVLESHLLNLSKRNEQDTFEKFAIGLCQVEISPNIKPNTGPAGGGDGKTDAETYPVSKDSAIGWYAGYETAGSDQKLAYAISAKKAWESKLKLDLESISKTEGKFTRIYFVTNQYVKADKRKKLEKELSKKYSSEVHILDLTWILQTVYDHNRLELAVKKLGIEVDSEPLSDAGPHDMARQKQIAHLEKGIEDHISNATVSYTTVRNAIDVAVLSREQELPRAEVEGRLDRAIRLADRNGTVNQRFMSRYQKCWSAFWYFEDYQSLKDWYDDAEKHALEAGGINNLEKLSNLHQILETAQDKDKTVVPKSFLATKTQTLTDELQKVAGNSEAPSSALFARTLLAQLSITAAIRSNQSVDDCLEEFESILSESESYPGFPFEAVSEILTIFGEIVEDSDKYEPVFTKLREIAAKRDGEKRSAEMVLERANVLIDKDKYYKAIEILGSSLPDFYKEETMSEAAEALFLIGTSYEQVGLLWAARGSYVNAASIETARFHSDDVVTPVQIGLYAAVLNTELRLGRLPQVLQWHEIFSMMIGILSPDEWNIEKLYERSLINDLKLGSIILTTKEDADHIAQAIPILDRLELDNAVIAADLRADRTDLWPSDFTDNVKEDEREQFFANWAKQVPEERVPENLSYYDDDTAVLTTHVAGCEISVHFSNTVLNTMTAESILSSVESFMATILLHDGMGSEPKLEVHLINNSDKTYEISAHFNADSMDLELGVPNFNPNSVTADNQAILSKSLQDIAVKVMAAIVIFKDTEKSLEGLLVKEKAFIRSTSFTASYIRLGNVVGYKPKYRLSDWATEGDKAVSPGDKTPKPLAMMSTSKKRSEEFSFENVSHTQIRTLSVIKQAYWDKAEWGGVLYMTAPDSDEMPIMALIFKDPEAGSKIFEYWKKQYGAADEDEAIRIAIMRNIDVEFPADYRFGVSANVKGSAAKGMLVASATRIHTMTPDDKVNLDRFLGQYKKIGSYKLTIAAITADGRPMMPTDLGIIKKELIVKTPDQVGEDDPDKVLVGGSRKNQG